MISCALPGHKASLSGSRIGGQFHHLLLPGHHFGGSTKFDLLFERFISSARNEPPDIDVDFEHERREEVIQYIYQEIRTGPRGHRGHGNPGAAEGSDPRCGQGHGARRWIRSTDLSSSIWEFTDEWLEGQTASFRTGTESAMIPILRKTLELTEQLMGFPRQLGSIPADL